MIHSQSFESTSVKQIRYDDNTRVMTITYNPGTQYEYYQVPFSVYSNALKADSIGTYVAKEIKGNFEFKKV